MRRAAFAFWIFAGQAQDPASTGEVPEYALKAAFLLNFAKYVEWPSRSFEDQEAAIHVAVLGRDPFGPELEAVLKGKIVRGRPLKLRRVGRPSDLRDVHIVFVPRSEERRLPEILARALSGAVLVVGESGEFCRAGGALSILVDNGKPRIEANPEAAARAALKIDAKLLKIATIVRGAP
ncbi:MAG TPA: YfiR family protein [Planctomycetota bacterium]